MHYIRQQALYGIQSVTVCTVTVSTALSTEHGDKNNNFVTKLKNQMKNT